MRPITAIECLLSGLPMGTLVSAAASSAVVIEGGPYHQRVIHPGWARKAAGGDNL
jgi:hypothetical protein